MPADLTNSKAITGRARGLVAIIIIGVIVVAGIGTLALDTRNDLGDETDARIDTNELALQTGCRERNDLRAAIVALAENATTGTGAITPELIDSIQDPEIRRVLEVVGSGSAMSRQAFIDALEDFRRQPENCSTARFGGG